MTLPRLVHWGAVACWLVLLTLRVVPAGAQTLTTRGFVEGHGTAYPQDAPNDVTNLVLDVLARGEAFFEPVRWLEIGAGVDARANSHDQVSDSLAIDFLNRGARRPALGIRRLSATLARGPLTLDAGKQFIRWGKTDIVTPTDRFAPRDFMDVVNTEFLPVTGARLTIQAGADAFDVAWVPLFTPSRIPLLDQRWGAVGAPPDVVFVDNTAEFPERAQIGVRWTHMGSGLEYSASFFDGYNHLPNIETQPGSVPIVVEFVRRYPALRMYGADAAIPSPWFTLKAEGGYFTSPDATGDEYVLYVFQLERQTGEWLITGGYAGEAVIERRVPLAFAPDRGMARSIIGRASYTIDPSRSAAIETAVQQDGSGVYVRGEYSWTRGQHWRTTVTGAILAGDPDDFIGQYRRNSNATLTLRYSF